MKIHSAVDKKHYKAIKKNAKLVGLDKVQDALYYLYKLGSKSEGSNQRILIQRGIPLLVGTEEFVWIAIVNISDWYKTSPVLKCEKIKTGFKIETENSYYELEKP